MTTFSENTEFYTKIIKLPNPQRISGSWSTGSGTVSSPSGTFVAVSKTVTLNFEQSMVHMQFKFSGDSALPDQTKWHVLHGQYFDLEKNGSITNADPTLIISRESTSLKMTVFFENGLASADQDYDNIDIDYVIREINYPWESEYGG